jgi:hypothetical protein
MYIVATEPVSTAYFINLCHQSVCLYVYPPIVARQRLGKVYPSLLGNGNSRRIVERVIFCAVRVV